MIERFVGSSEHISIIQKRKPPHSSRASFQTRIPDIHNYTAKIFFAVILWGNDGLISFQGLARNRFVSRIFFPDKTENFSANHHEPTYQGRLQLPASVIGNATEFTNLKPSINESALIPLTSTSLAMFSAYFYPVFPVPSLRFLNLWQSPDLI